MVNPLVDPTWRFMTLDWDGKIRMDCSSPSAMASLVGRKDEFQIATGNDADADRHGIVTPDGGLMNPNHFLAVAIAYLLSHRPDWSPTTAVGKTLVSSSLIDRVVADMRRPLVEVPVGFKWFVPGLLDGSVGFGGEESAGASFLRRDGSVWTTDKDGILLALLASEIQAVTGRSPSKLHKQLTDHFGESAYARIDAPATRAEKAALGKLSPDAVTATELAGEPITAKLTTAPGNDAPIGGLKVTTENAWFAARPSGTEDVYKIYAESFHGPEHLAQVQEEAQRGRGRCAGRLTVDVVALLRELVGRDHRLRRPRPAAGRDGRRRRGAARAGAAPAGRPRGRTPTTRGPCCGRPRTTTGRSCCWPATSTPSRCRTPASGSATRSAPTSTAGACGAAAAAT